MRKTQTVKNDIFSSFRFVLFIFLVFFFFHFAFYFSCVIDVAQSNEIYTSRCLNNDHVLLMKIKKSISFICANSRIQKWNKFSSKWKSTKSKINFMKLNSAQTEPLWVFHCSNSCWTKILFSLHQHRTFIVTC